MYNIIYIRKRNQVLKFLFLISGIIIICLIFFPFINKTKDIIDPLEANKLTKLSAELNLSIENSIFEGQSKDKLPYKIKAGLVTKRNDSIYNLNSISANYNIASGDLKILAKTGIFNELTKILIFHENVKIAFQDLILISNKINFDLNNNSVLGEHPVEVNFKNSKIKASSFNTEDLNNQINFEGNVVSTFDLNDF